MISTQQTEACWIGTYHDEQASAFTTLFNTYSHALLTVLIRLVNDHERAEDLLQDTFVKAWTHLHQYDPALSRPYTWLLTISRHVALDELRHRKVQAQAVAYIGERMGEWTLPTVQDGLLNGSIFTLLRPHQRQIMELYYLHGLTQLEIAQELGLPIGTIKTRTRCALQELKQIFSQDIVYYHRCIPAYRPVHAIRNQPERSL